jgi:lipopolysaccharide export system protein LptA
MNRTKKLRLIQISLFLLGSLIIFITYKDNSNLSKNNVVTNEIRGKVDKQKNISSSGDIFYNIEYSGLDLSGNRYVLKSKEAITSKSNINIVKMKSVEATFYFKDDNILNVMSDEGDYNNKTLDMTFSKNVEADYMQSKLYADKAEFSNSQSYLIITENVIVEDIRGTVLADRLLFDIKKQTLQIAAFNDDKINANINLK